MSPKAPEHEGFYRALIRQILHSRRTVTVMFTDVEGSTRYWDAHGDVQGRLMIDLHNRLLCPVISAHRGRVVKHAGDAILACFRSPKQALRAAIAIQQVLERQRAGGGAGLPPVRIGLHTGPVLVEKNDIYGDAVNLAARLAKHPAGCEITVSGGTVARVSRKAFNLVRRGEFVPKGKREPVVAYECRWPDHPSLVGETGEFPRLGLVRGQKLELAGCYLVAVGAAWFLGARYLRWLLADRPELSLAALGHPLAVAAAPAALVAVLLAAAVLLGRRGLGAHLPFRAMRGGAGFAAAFLPLWLAAQFLTGDPGGHWEGELCRTRHDFAEALVPGVQALPSPASRAAPVRVLERGDLLIVRGVDERRDQTWVSVLADPEREAWVAWKLPPRLGVPEVQQVQLTRLSFKYKDLYALAAGLLGFLWGALSFRIRPA